MGIFKDEFYVLIWFISWVVDDDYGFKVVGVEGIDFIVLKEEEDGDKVEDDFLSSVEEVVKKMKFMERVFLGFKCK